MKDDKDISALLGKAKESLEATAHLFNGGFYDISASRSYYAMFYATEAVLLTKNLSFSKHSAVISAFGKEFIKPGPLHHKLHRYLTDAFDKRQLGDYSVLGSISKTKAKELITRAREFVKEIEEYLRSEGYAV